MHTKSERKQFSSNEDPILYVESSHLEKNKPLNNKK